MWASLPVDVGHQTTIDKLIKIGRVVIFIEDSHDDHGLVRLEMLFGT